LVTGGIDEAPPGSKKAAGSAQAGKARTVDCCEQANALIDRIAGGWSATLPKVRFMELARFRSYRSPPMKSAECSRDSAQWHGSRRDHEGIESAPVRRRRRGRAERNSDGDRAFEFVNANLGCEFLDDAPYGLLRYAFPPSSTRATHTPKKRSRLNSGSLVHSSTRPYTQAGTRMVRT
jgi:hypothetical protein